MFKWVAASVLTCAIGSIALTTYLCFSNNRLEQELATMSKINRNDQDIIAGYNMQLNTYSEQLFRGCGNMYLREIKPEFRISYKTCDSKTDKVCVQ